MLDDFDTPRALEALLTLAGDARAYADAAQRASASSADGGGGAYPVAVDGGAADDDAPDDFADAASDICCFSRACPVGGVVFTLGCR